jgi:exodeoxyribonuclease V alpha subunit
VSDEQLEGVVERVTFHNEENGYCVLRVTVRGLADTVTVIGHVPSVNPGEEIVARGQWVNSADFGRQFKAVGIATSEPNSLAGIERYLGSNLIDGIGPVYAKKLVAKFGAEIFDIIDKNSARLEEVPGVGKKRRREIKASWERQKAVRGIMVFLHEHGISTARAVRIFKTYGEESLDVLRENPYRLARDIRGIGFKTADDIAQKLGIPKDSPERLRAGISHVLLSATDRGHCALPEGELVGLASELLAVAGAGVGRVLGQMLGFGELVREDPGGAGRELVFLPHLKHAEEVVAARLRRLVGQPPAYPQMEAVAALDWVEKQTGKALGDEQRAAVVEALGRRVLVITGGPGVGKTTILDSLLKILVAKGVDPVLCAPTGRAAKRLSESTGLEARTVHRLLEFQSGEKGFARREGNPLKGDLFVMDEASMVDVVLMHHFLRALPEGAHLLLVGDVDQLPSVGPGEVLGDIIGSGLVPVVRLTQIYRQAAASRIITSAHAINRGELPELEVAKGADSDFYFFGRDQPEATLKTVIQLVSQRLPAKFGLDASRDVQVLCPMNRGSLGTQNLNVELQAALNPPSEMKFEVERFGVTYRHGDKVIQGRNNYDKEVYNGDIGVIVEIATDPGRIVVRFDDGRLANYEPGELDELSLAYAITIHKSQGSEFPVVVMPVSMQQFVLLRRNLFDTGITRGRRLVVLVGERKALELAVGQGDSGERYGGLLARLRESGVSGCGEGDSA